jgi:hypothetical protein
MDGGGGSQPSMDGGTTGTGTPMLAGARLALPGLAVGAMVAGTTLALSGLGVGAGSGTAGVGASSGTTSGTATSTAAGIFGIGVGALFAALAVAGVILLYPLEIAEEPAVPRPSPRPPVARMPPSAIEAARRIAQGRSEASARSTR